VGNREGGREGGHCEKRGTGINYVGHSAYNSLTKITDPELCCMHHTMTKHVPISSSVRLWAMSSVRVGMSIPYTLLKRTGGAALAKKT
jgi:hypothetical protein